ncbi:hypothetical protein GCM10022255_109950 [Dactylosporangium darangshiense]|jgi:hypothetical protein|uniref:Uncharacterized protein n=1 Tax=Dactylosporangium darangshiense TaxID=579108 RepID=A0ABP8DVC8_9ACTN
MTAEMPNSPVTWDQPDDELDELAGPDSDLLEEDPDQASQTDFFWEDDEE